MSTAVRQDINLLQDELQERKARLPASQTLLIIGVVALLLATLAIWMNLRADAPRAELARINAQIEAHSATNAQLAALLETRKPDPALALEARRLERRLAHLHHVTAIAATPRERSPLSAYLEGLGRQRPEGLWLTQIVIANGGRDLALDGSTLNAALLPGYLEGLGRENAFAGLTFHQFNLARASGQPLRMDFRITAGCPDGNAGMPACARPEGSDR
jgi:hypothetical protein